MALLTESDVLDARFKASSSIREGYNPDQVDSFLDKVAKTIAQLTTQKAELENELKKAQTQIAELENSGITTGCSEAPFPAMIMVSFAPVGGGVARGGDTNAVADMFILTQQLHDKYISGGKAGADRIFAKVDAKSQRATAETEEQHNRTLAQPEQERGLLERRVSELRGSEWDYHTRLESYLGSLLANVESGSTPSSDQR